VIIVDDSITATAQYNELLDSIKQTLAATASMCRLTMSCAGKTMLCAVFGTPGPEVPNATELEALSGLGGAERSAYRLRFAQSPLALRSRDATVVQITPGQQRIMAEAAVYLRTEQPRNDVTVEGIVVRLSRSGSQGPGVVVVEGIAEPRSWLRLNASRRRGNW
jgi:hypothetical protein